ncbi:MAG: SMC-Scp complex subunit ScpB [Candidatus Brocadiia bacterium]
MSETENIKLIIEALLFASDKPLDIKKLKYILGGNVTDEQVKQTIQELKTEYESTPRAFTVFEIANGYQLRTKTDYQPYLVKLKESRSEGVLSNAALETLSIIAYKQPIARAEIEAIRGVDSSAIVRGLMDKKLVKISGRAEELGRPILYGTTNNFLELLGLGSIKDLPKPIELAGRTEEPKTSGTDKNQVRSGENQ